MSSLIWLLQVLHHSRISSRQFEKDHLSEFIFGAACKEKKLLTFFVSFLLVLYLINYPAAELLVRRQQYCLNTK